MQRRKVRFIRCFRFFVVRRCWSFKLQLNLSSSTLWQSRLRRPLKRVPPSLRSVTLPALLRRHDSATCLVSSPPSISSFPPVTAAHAPPVVPPVTSSATSPLLPGTRPAIFRRKRRHGAPDPFPTHTVCGLRVAAHTPSVRVWNARPPRPPHRAGAYASKLALALLARRTSAAV